MNLGQAGIELPGLLSGAQSFLGPRIFLRGLIKGHARIGHAGIGQREAGILSYGLAVKLKRRVITFGVGLASHHLAAFEVEFIGPVIAGRA